MKRIISIFCLLFTVQGFAQSYFPTNQFSSTSVNTKKYKAPNNKAYGDTLWTEDFNGGLPSGWSIVNNNPNNFQWMWDTTYRAGQFSFHVSALNSSTAANGFMSLPMDWYNTPIPAFSAVYFDTYFESPPIAIPNKLSLELRAQQFTRFCCSSGRSFILQVSNDAFATFDEYSMSDRAVNAQSANVDFVKINISKTAAGQDTIYLRFLADQGTHYFWMIDDLALVEGTGQEISHVNFGIPHLKPKPFPVISPTGYLKDISFQVGIRNPTIDTITGVSVKLDIRHVLGANGSSPLGLVYSSTAPANNNGEIYAQQIDTILTTTASNFIPLTLGNYQVDFSSNSIEYLQLDSAKLSFTISDTTFGRDFNNPTGKAGGPGYITWAPVDGNKFGSLYVIDSIASNIQFASVSYYIPNDPNIVGSIIRPVIWEYNSDTTFFGSGVNAAFGRELTSSLDSFRVDSTHLNSWQTLKLDTGLAMNRATNFGEFVVGWEQVGGAASQGAYFEVGNDTLAARVAPDVSHFSWLAHLQQPNWWSVRSGAMIRLNVKPLSVGMDREISSENVIHIFPNPSNGIFNINAEENIREVSVFDLNGRQVEVHYEGGSINLNGQPSGIYFVTFETNNGEKETKKLIKR